MVSSTTTSLILLIFLLFNLVSSQQVCSPSTNYGMIIGLCKCPPSGIMIDGWCSSCAVSNCLLCSIGSVSECDVCAAGFILDQLTKSTCVPETNSSLTCTQQTCACSPYEIHKDGKCLTCSVPNCLLCQVSSPNKCDICHNGFTLDKLTNTECVPIINKTKSCTAQSCACSAYQVSINNTCLSCKVSNCRLCAVGNQNECDICNEGYVLDQLTKSMCMRAVGSAISCTEKSCACLPYQVNVNGTCLACQVKNCTLCAVGNQNECDVCSVGYVLDQLTKSSCLLASNSTPSCTANSCKCSPFQSNVNGICKTCQIPSCTLCSINNPKQCDICESGYILDALTHSECFLAHDQQIVCKSNSNTCKCSPYQIKINNNQCVECQVQKCQLCEVDNATACDICKNPYVYNMQSKQCDPPACEQNMIWVVDHCECDRNVAFMNSEGNCEKVDQVKQLGFALGIGISLVFISIAMLALVKLSAVSQPSAGLIHPQTAKNFNELSQVLPNGSNVKTMQEEFR